MAEVHLTVNGRSYPVSCDEGQQARLKELAQYLDRKTADFAAKLGQIGEARLIVLAALVVTDELADAQAQLRRHATGAASGNGVDTDTLSQGLDELAERIEAIAERLETHHVHS
ncbi:MAG TPA: cell division protein ZapA [Stellaceae bacterium]|nr:cell division protein ZapA [Stellaceae bacterium]